MPRGYEPSCRGATSAALRGSIRAGDVLRGCRRADKSWLCVFPIAEEDSNFWLVAWRCAVVCGRAEGLERLECLDFVHPPRAILVVEHQLAIIYLLHEVEKDRKRHVWCQQKLPHGLPPRTSQRLKICESSGYGERFRRLTTSVPQTS